MTKFWLRNDGIEDYSSGAASRTSKGNPEIPTNDSAIRSGTTGRSRSPDKVMDLQGSNIKISEPNYHDFHNRRTFHKMASSTFKSVSDTIRSKAQVFYVETERPDITCSAEPAHRGKHEYMSRVLSSVRSRTSRNKLNDDFHSPFQIATQKSDIPHEIHIEIPDSTLLETMGLPRRETTNEKTHCYTPLTTASSQEGAGSKTSVDGSASPLSSRSLITDTNVDPKYMKSRGSEHDASHISDDQTLLKARQLDEKDSGNDVGSVGNKGSLDNSSLGGSNQIPISPQPTISSTRSHLGGNLFVKGNHEQPRNFGIPSPYRRALRLSEEAASESSACFSNGTHEVGRESEERKVQSHPSLKLTTSILSGLNGLAMISTAQVWPLSTAETEFNNSEAYDADEEYGSEKSEEPNMGPKSSWEKVRADRQRRYQYVRSMSAETASDHGYVPGLELHLTKDCTQIRDSASILKARSVSSVVAPDSGHRVCFGPPLDSTHVMHDSIREEITDQNLAGGLKCSVEAIQRCVSAEAKLINDKPEQKKANLKDQKEVTDIGRFLTMPPACLRENRLPKPGSQIRTCSAHSDTTSSTCAITTSSQLCYQPVPEESHHVRTNHVRRTSSIIDEIDQVRHDLKSREWDPEPSIPLPSMEQAGWSKITEVPVVTTENTVIPFDDSGNENTDKRYSFCAPPAYVERLLDSGASQSMSTILSNDTQATNLPPAYYESDRRSSFETNDPHISVNDRSPETLPPLPKGSNTPYHEPFVNVAIHRSMPGESIPPPEKQLLKSLSGNSKMNKTAGKTVDLSISIPVTRPSSVDFSMMNPEVDHYLAHAPSETPFQATESEYSDEETLFRTSVNIPLKQDHRAKSRTENCAQLGSPRLRVSGEVPESYQLQDTSNIFVAARLPEFATKLANEIDPSAIERSVSPTYDEYTLRDVMRPKEITPFTSLSGRSYCKDQSWQMDGTSYDPREFPYCSVDSSHTQLQTSSLKKGVWWTRVQEMLSESESPCAGKQFIHTLDNELNKADDTLRSVEECIHESNVTIDDVRALLAAELIQGLQNKSSLSSTEIHNDGYEDDKVAFATQNFLDIENRIQQNHESIVDITTLLTPANPIMTESDPERSLGHTIGDSKRDHQDTSRHVTVKYQVCVPEGAEHSLSPADTIHVCNKSSS